MPKKLSTPLPTWLPPQLPTVSPWQTWLPPMLLYLPNWIRHNTTLSPPYSPMPPSPNSSQLTALTPGPTTKPLTLAQSTTLATPSTAITAGHVATVLHTPAAIALIANQATCKMKNELAQLVVLLPTNPSDSQWGPLPLTVVFLIIEKTFPETLLALSTYCIFSCSPIVATSDAILDSGCTSHFFTANTPATNIDTTALTQKLGTPNRVTILSCISVTNCFW